MEISFRPINDVCLDCDATVEPHTRQELAWDERGRCRRRCGVCIGKMDRTPVSNTTGMNP